MSAADAGPPTAANDFKLRRQPFVQPDRENIVARHEAALAGQLMDHFMGRRAQIDRPPI